MYVENFHPSLSLMFHVYSIQSHVQNNVGYTLYISEYNLKFATENHTSQVLVVFTVSSKTVFVRAV